MGFLQEFFGHQVEHHSDREAHESLSESFTGGGQEKAARRGSRDYGKSEPAGGAEDRSDIRLAIQFARAAADREPESQEFKGEGQHQQAPHARPDRESKSDQYAVHSDIQTRSQEEPGISPGFEDPIRDSFNGHHQRRAQNETQTQGQGLPGLKDFWNQFRSDYAEDDTRGEVPNYAPEGRRRGAESCERGPEDQGKSGGRSSPKCIIEVQIVPS